MTNTDKNSEDNSSNLEDMPQYVKLLKSSVVLNVCYEYGLKLLMNKLNETELMKQPKNVKYLCLGLGLLFASSLMALIHNYLFYFMTFYGSLKCVLWLFEQYNPKNTTDEVVNDKYVTENSASDLIELMIVPIFISFVLTPLSYLPLPFVYFLSKVVGTLLGLGSLVNKSYRQQFCVFIRDVFTDKNSRVNGTYISGNESEVHKFLQVLCYTIESVNLSAFNITHSPRKVMTELDEVNTLGKGLGVLTKGLEFNGTESVTHQKPKKVDFSELDSDELDDES